MSWESDPNESSVEGNITGGTTHTSFTVTNGRLGDKRIAYPSVKVTKDYLIYTYIRQTLVDLSAFTLNDGTSNDYEFDARIVGIINKETGIRKEYEVTTELLGMHLGHFDRTLPAAIGLHKGGN